MSSEIEISTTGYDGGQIVPVRVAREVASELRLARANAFAVASDALGPNFGDSGSHPPAVRCGSAGSLGGDRFVLCIALIGTDQINS